MFKPKPGEWDCPKCMTRNKADAKIKCMSCEEAKPGAPAAPSGGGEPSTATVTLDLDGVGTGGVAVQGSVQLKVVIPCADDRIAALEARVKELEAENADLKKKNRELGNKLTD